MKSSIIASILGLAVAQDTMTLSSSPYSSTSTGVKYTSSLSGAGGKYGGYDSSKITLGGG